MRETKTRRLHMIHNRSGWCAPFIHLYLTLMLIGMSSGSQTGHGAPVKCTVPFGLAKVGANKGGFCPQEKTSLITRYSSAGKDAGSDRHGSGQTTGLAGTATPSPRQIRVGFVKPTPSASGSGICCDTHLLALHNKYLFAWPCP